MSLKGHSPLNFRPMSVVAKRLDGLRYATWYGDRPPYQEKGHIHPTQFLVHVYCGQTAGRMKTPLGTEVDLGPGHTVLDGVPALPRMGHSSPPRIFGSCLLWPRSPISATAELLLRYVSGQIDPQTDTLIAIFRTSTGSKVTSWE